MEKRRRNGHRVKVHIGQEVGNFQWVAEVRLTRTADLAFVLRGRKRIGPPQKLNVGIRTVSPNFLDKIFELNHDKRCTINEIRYFRTILTP